MVIVCSIFNQDQKTYLRNYNPYIYKPFQYQTTKTLIQNLKNFEDLVILANFYFHLQVKHECKTCLEIIGLLQGFRKFVLRAFFIGVNRRVNLSKYRAKVWLIPATCDKWCRFINYVWACVQNLLNDRKKIPKIWKRFC